MFIKPGDFIKVRPRDPDLWDKLVIRMFMVGEILGDPQTLKLLGDCAIISSDSNIYPLTDFEITYINGLDLISIIDDPL